MSPPPDQGLDGGSRNRENEILFGGKIDKTCWWINMKRTGKTPDDSYILGQNE